MKPATYAKRARLVRVMLQIKALDQGEYERLLAILKATARMSRIRRASGVN